MTACRDPATCARYAHAYNLDMEAAPPRVAQACEPHKLMRMVQGLESLLALPGEVLIAQDSLSRGLYFIMRGSVALVRKRYKEDLRRFNYSFEFGRADPNVRRPLPG